MNSCIECNGANGRFLNARNWTGGEYIVGRNICILAMYVLFARSMEGEGFVEYMSLIISKLRYKSHMATEHGTANYATLCHITRI